MEMKRGVIAWVIAAHLDNVFECEKWKEINWEEIRSRLLQGEGMLLPDRDIIELEEGQ